MSPDFSKQPLQMEKKCKLVRCLTALLPLSLIFFFFFICRKNIVQTEIFLAEFVILELRGPCISYDASIIKDNCSKKIL